MSQLTEHFSLTEFTASEVAARRDIDNTMPAVYLPAAIALCKNILEPARAALGPLRVNSGYRCKALNSAIGGAWGSQHQFGQAADIIPLAAGVRLFDLFNWLVSNAPYDQLIWEFGAWVHVSYTESLRRRQILVAAVVPGKKRAAYTEISADQLSTLL